MFQLLNEKTAKFAEGIVGLVAQGGLVAPVTSSSRAAQEREFVASLPSLPGLFDYDAASVADAEPMQGVAETAAEYADSDDVRQSDDMESDDAVAETQCQPSPDLSVVNTEDKPDTEHEYIFETEISAEIESESDGLRSVGAVYDEQQTIQTPVKEQSCKQHVRHEPGELRRMFTVNDKFRFRRELFGNSDTEFTDTLNLVEAMRNYSEAEDYFYNDLSWDADATEVQEFMAVVNRYFSK